MIRDYYAAGKLDELSNELLNESLDEETRNRLGQIHPSLMGGEYLPDYRRQEVEIVRIELKSTTSDVISLRARSSGSRIKYRLVDENDSGYGLPQQSSKRPFSLRELISFLDSVEHVGGDPAWHAFGFVLSFNEIESVKFRGQSGHAAFASVLPRKAGYQRRKVSSRSPLRTLVRVCSKRCAPRGVHRICCFFTNRLLMT